MIRPLVLAACPAIGRCTFVARGATEAAAFDALADHLRQRHVIEYALRRVGVVQPDGQILTDAGDCHLPALYRFRRVWH